MPEDKFDIVLQIYDAVSRKDAGAAVMQCLRLARLSRDPIGIADFHFEMDPRGEDAARRIYDDLSYLDDDKFSYLMERSQKVILEARTFSESDKKVLGLKGTPVLYVSAGMYEGEMAACDDHANVLSLPSGMSPFDTAAMYAERERPRSFLAYKKLAIVRLRDRTIAKCFDNASQVEKQVLISQASNRSIAEIEGQVFAFLRDLSPNSYAQLTDAADKLLSDRQEDLSSASLQIRRCLKSVADALLPEVEIAPGLEPDKYLNRLSYYLETHSKNPASAATFDHKVLEKLLRRISDRASKGVHSDLTKFEGRQIYIGLMLYFHQISEIAFLKGKSVA